MFNISTACWSKVQTCIRPSWCHCHSLSLASVKSRLVLPFWYWLIWVVREKGPLSGCVYINCMLFLAENVQNVEYADNGQASAYPNTTPQKRGWPEVLPVMQFLRPTQGCFSQTHSSSIGWATSAGLTNVSNTHSHERILVVTNQSRKTNTQIHNQYATQLAAWRSG